MPIRDQQPNYMMGFGLMSRHVPYDDPQDQQGPRPETGILSKALHGHPFMKFAATAAATFVGMEVAGKFVREGGLKLTARWAENARPWQNNLIGDIRKLQGLFDSWEGVTRDAAHIADPLGKFDFRGDRPINWFFTASERAAAQAGKEPLVVSNWKDNLQRSLVHNARRLPYQLPAAYATQRMVIDPLFGNDKNDRPKWYNPIDVLGDFAQQSIKNTFQMIIPFEAGAQAGSQGWRKVMSMGDNNVNLTPNMRRARGASVFLGEQLARVGQDVGQMLYKSAYYSNKSTGAFGAAIHESVGSSKGIVQHLHENRSRLSRERGQDIGFWRAFPSAFKPSSGIGDVKLGPFGGMQTFGQTAKQRWSAYAPPGGSDIERIAQALATLGQDSVPESLRAEEGAIRHGEPSAFAHGEWYRKKMSASYSALVEQQLMQQGVDPELANKTINKLTNVRLPYGNRRDLVHQLWNFGDDPVVNTLGVGLEELGVSRRTFERSVNAANRDFKNNRPSISSRINAEWSEAYENQILPYAKRRLKKAPLPYDVLNSKPSEEGAAYIYRQMAEGIGYQGLSDKEVYATLQRRGFDLTRPNQIRDFLVSQKIISPAHNREGYNVFGLRPLTVENAFQKGFFTNKHGGSRLSHDEDIHLAALRKGLDTGDPVLGGLSQHRVGGSTFETRGGAVLNFAPLMRSLRRGVDIIHEQVQTPLIHIRAAITGYPSFRSFRESPMIQMFTGAEGLGGGLNARLKTDESALFLKTSAGKGEVFKVGHRLKDGRSRPYSEKLMEGTFRSIRTDDWTLMGRHARMGRGDKGRIPGYFDDEGNFIRNERSRINRWFSVDEDQPQSLFGYYQRFRHRRTDLNNPRVYADRLARGDLEGVPAHVQARSAIRLQQDLRNRGIPNVVMRRMAQEARAGEDSFLSDRLRSILTDQGGGGIAAMNETDLGDYAEKLMRQDRQVGLIVGNRDYEPSLRSAQTRVWRYINRRSEQGYLDHLTNPQAARYGIHRRLDQFRNDIYQYLFNRQAIIQASQGKGSESVLTDLLNAVDEMKVRHQITGKAYTETRAALLGMQLDLERQLTRATLKQSDVETQMRSAAGNLVSRYQTVNGKKVPRQSRELLEQYANFEDRLPPGGTGPAGALNRARRAAMKGGSFAPYEYPGLRYNPFGGGQGNTLVPTLGTSFMRHPLRTALNVGGLSTYRDPETWTPSSAVTSHLYQRLNRFFGTFGAGLDETDFTGPLDLYTRGMVGKRVLPITAGLGALGAGDRTLGRLRRKRDDEGNVVYPPLIGGVAANVLAHGEMLGAGLMGGRAGYRAKKQELEEGEVPIRRGRWWPLGNTPWKGGRTMYYRPSWYRRYMSGYKYTDQTFGTPLEHLAYDSDFSPLRLADPYHFEKKHYADRPYPVTGEYFTGPWGPLTGALNSTIGRFLKPPIRMHQDEMAAGLAGYVPKGQYGAIPNRGLDEDQRVLMRTAKRSTVQVPMAAKAVLGLSPLGFGEAAGGRGGAVAHINTNADGRGGTSQVIMPGGRRGPGVGGGDAAVIPGFSTGSSRAGGISRGTLEQLNAFYADNKDPKPRRTAYGYPTLISPNGLSERLVPNAPPVNPESNKYQRSMLKYQSKELFGIYGFGGSEAYHTLTGTPSDFSPQRGVLQSASRAYGSERAFWDLNLGGLGDFPTPFEGEAGNLEISEIVRRFIPHRRRDENEINPIPNALGKQYPWLPGENYFTNYQHGDPYTHIPEGELRLPGTGYERFHKLRSDSTGRYGLTDKFAVLGDIAPWSDEYRALGQVLANTKLSPDEQAAVRTTKAHVREMRKVKEFHPYTRAYQNFQTVDTHVTGYVPGRADQFTVEGFKDPIRLAGVRASRRNKSQPARRYMEKYVQPGQEVSLTYDAGAGKATNATGTIDAYMKANGIDINRRLLYSGYGKAARSETPLDLNANEGTITHNLKATAEKLAHRNTFINSKFLPYRTPTEDWERQNVYGATFPQWQHPIRDFLKPMVYRAANRDVITGTLALSGAGALFGTTPTGHVVGGMIGGLVGLSTALFTDARTQDTGQRFVPLARRKELALEEYSDVLKYVKYNALYGRAREAAIKKEHRDPEELMRELPKGTRRFRPVGPITQQAIQYKQQINRTMYGANPFGDVMDLNQAIPKRKRRHFMELLNAPQRDRARILSTAGRLERRIYEARWGLKVEKRPKLDDYFTKHELPPPNWEGWRPDTDLEAVKLKIGEHQGIDLSQMGYYPQQIREANLLNPSYPDFNKQSKPRDVHAQLEKMLRDKNIQGSVRSMSTPFGGTNVKFHGQVNN